MLIRLAQFASVDHEELEVAYADARQLLPADDIAGHAELLMSYGSRQLHLGRIDVAAGLHQQAIDMAMAHGRSEEHTSELQSLMRNSYAVFCQKKTTLKNKKRQNTL